MQYFLVIVILSGNGIGGASPAVTTIPYAVNWSRCEAAAKELRDRRPGKVETFCVAL